MVRLKVTRTLRWKCCYPGGVHCELRTASSRGKKRVGSRKSRRLEHSILDLLTPDFLSVIDCFLEP